MIPAVLVVAFSVPDAWLTRTSWLESRHNPAAIGDGGRSRGMYQIQRRTWETPRYHARLPWRVWAHDPVESHRIAKLILNDCCRACMRHKQPVTFNRVRWYYRHGGFRHYRKDERSRRIDRVRRSEVRPARCGGPER